MIFNKIKRRLLSSISVAIIVALCPIQTFATPTSSEAKTELAKLENDAQQNLKEINELESQLVSVGEKIIKNKEELKKAEENYEKTYEDTKDLIQFLYENNTDDIKVEKIINTKSLASLNSDLENINQIQKYSKKKLKTFQEAAEKVQTIQTNLETQENTLQEKEKELNKKGEELEKQISDKKIEISDLMQKENEETLKKNAELTKQQASVNISIDPDATTADKIIQAAYSQLGVPYVWGGTTPNVGLDCSGLTQWCYSQAGISLPRLAEAQGSGTQISEPTPGCLVAYPHHIAIFLKQDTDGTRWMIAAPKTGDVVKIQKVYGNPWYVRWF